MTNKIEWRDEERELIRSMWAGGQSMTEIGDTLGCSRGAIAGLISRMKLAKMPKPRGPAAIPKPRVRSRPNMQTINARFAASRIPIAPHVPARHKASRHTRKTLLDLAYGDCRWPCGDVGDPGFFFCGASAADGVPYCAKHCAIAYRGYRHAEVTA